MISQATKIKINLSKRLCLTHLSLNYIFETKGDMMKKRIFVLIFIIVLTAGGWIYYRQYQNHTAEKEITLYGNVDIREVDIGFQVNGIIQKMNFEEGEVVKKGDILAELNPKDYQENYLQSGAEIKRLTAIRDEAKSVLDTHTPLQKEGYTSKREYTSYLNKLHEAEGALESAIILQRIQKNQLDYTKVYAPEEGIVTARVQEPGATVQTGQIIYTIAKNSPVWIRSYIPEKYLGNIVYGTTTRVITDSIDPKTNQKRAYNGRIGYISPVAEFTPKSVETTDLRTDLVYRIHVYIDEPDGFLKQGMPTTIKINP